MKSTVLWVLVVVNALLLGSFVSKFTRAGSALAQPNRQAQPPRPGDYLMIPGDVTGGTSGIVYMLDTTNGKLSAVTYDESNRRLVNMQSIDLAPIFQRVAQGGGNARPNR